MPFPRGSQFGQGSRMIDRGGRQRQLPILNHKGWKDAT
ncbi:MAG: hypothetical protein [Olavius algarvensis Gamma 1 endosymbiont]|nr:MAG: hypothetical protein [Olavius algarvensis Gamma 1 endosymbiont]